jgi:hypothetical protein
MRILWFGLAACVLLAVSIQSRAAEPLVDLPPPIAAENGVCTPDGGSCGLGGCPSGVCGRPVASAVATAARAPATIVRRVATRIQRRPLLRRLFSSRARVGRCRR